MTLFRNVVFVAALSGLLAGLVLAALQSFATVPLILEAEAFENPGMAAHDHGTPARRARHEHDHGAWAPADGWNALLVRRVQLRQRHRLRAPSGSGFRSRRGIAGWRKGIAWGLAGFAVFSLARIWAAAGTSRHACCRSRRPPGLVAGDGGGDGSRSALIAFRRGVAWPLAGLALIVAPHLFGAPQPASHDTPVPADLHRQFVIAVTATSLVFWVVLGAIAGAVRQRFLGPSSSLSGRLA